MSNDALRSRSATLIQRWGPTLAIVGSVLAIIAVFACLMWESRLDAKRAAEASSGNLATAIAHDIDRNIELLDLSVQAARDGWSDPRVHALPLDLRQMLVFDHSATARYIDSILVVDRNGDVVLSSSSLAPPRENVDHADFYLAQVPADAGLFIGRPVKAPDTGTWRIAFSRRISAPDGSFAGVAVGFLDLGYLLDTYKTLPLGPGGMLSLFNTDGTLLVREPDVPAAIGRSFKGQPIFNGITAVAGGSFEATSTLDGTKRLFSFHRVGGLPLIQVVATGTDEVYADWRRRALALGSVLSVLCSGILLLVIALKRELRHRIEAEAALKALASTDPLTGLLNRRTFFDLAGARCAEAACFGLPVSVLMIDADHFKGFNDRYGHLAGDGALISIAASITGVLGDAGYPAARFGGEEFIVLLPGLDRSGAISVAEAIRVAVARLAIPHDVSADGVVTVSVGVASTEAGAPVVLDGIVEAADAELYRSKRGGRNRSSGGERVAARVPALPRSA